MFTYLLTYLLLLSTNSSHEQQTDIEQSIKRFRTQFQNVLENGV